MLLGFVMAHNEPKHSKKEDTKGSLVSKHQTSPEATTENSAKSKAGVHGWPTLPEAAKERTSPHSDGVDSPQDKMVGWAVQPTHSAHSKPQAYVMTDTEPAEKLLPSMETHDDSSLHQSPREIRKYTHENPTPNSGHPISASPYHEAAQPLHPTSPAVDSVQRWPPTLETQSLVPVSPHDYAHLGHPHPTPASGEVTVMAHIEAIRQAEESQSEKPYLVVMAGNLAGQIFNVNAERTLLGRSPDCEVSLFDVDISRIHAEIRQNAHGQLVLKDFDSTNGTYVNGKPIRQSELRDGDKIQLGCSTILKFAYQSVLEEMYQRRLYENAVQDGLTQIYNRKFFDERLTTEFSFAQRHNSSLSLLMIDLDHFKQVNDTYGHPTGDQVLRTVAQTVNTLLRKEDIIARYGGEEFAILARSIQPTQAAILGERIRNTIEHLDIPTATGLHLRVTASIGVVTMFHETFHSDQQFVQEGDNRLYRAKHQGRNQVVAEGL